MQTALVTLHILQNLERLSHACVYRHNTDRDVHCDPTLSITAIPPSTFSLHWLIMSCSVTVTVTCKTSDMCFAGSADAPPKSRVQPILKTKSSNNLSPAQSKSAVLTSRAYLGSSKMGSLDVHNGPHKLMLTKS